MLFHAHCALCVLIVCTLLLIFQQLLVQVVLHELLTAMASLLALPAATALHMLTAAKPDLVLNNGATAVTVGRARLDCSRRDSHTRALLSAAASGASKAAGAQSTNSRSKGAFAHTGHAMRLAERLAVAAQLSEPMLLVGEAGTGKTALIGYLAQQVRCWQAVSYLGVDSCVHLQHATCVFRIIARVALLCVRQL